MLLTLYKNNKEIKVSKLQEEMIKKLKQNGFSTEKETEILEEKIVDEVKKPKKTKKSKE